MVAISLQICSLTIARLQMLLGKSSMSIPEKLRLLITKKTDDELYAYFAAADEYTPETLESVRNEIRQRGLPDDQLDQLAAAAKQSAAAKKNRPTDSTFTFNGFGTRLYGKCDFRTDGSYITTMWITLLYWPIIPLRSLRIRPLEGSRYEVLERFKIHWQQVIRIYSFESWLLTSISLAAWIGERFSYEKESFAVLLVGVGVPFVWLYLVRSKERKKCLAKKAN